VTIFVDHPDSFRVQIRPMTAGTEFFYEKLIEIPAHRKLARTGPVPRINPARLNAPKAGIASGTERNPRPYRGAHNAETGRLA
jgi:hypothetical protein